MATLVKIENYKGFVINRTQQNLCKGSYYVIVKDGEVFSPMHFTGVKACKMVIDTWIKSQKQ